MIIINLTYKDSTNVLARSFFNGYDSFYGLPINPKAHMFINIYFDIVEVKRRKLQRIIKYKKLNEGEIIKYYNNINTELQIELDKLIKTVQRGEDRKVLIKWNDYVYENLGIDNLRLLLDYGVKEDIE